MEWFQCFRRLNIGVFKALLDLMLVCENQVYYEVGMRNVNLCFHQFLLINLYISSICHFITEHPSHYTAR